MFKLGRLLVRESGRFKNAKLNELIFWTGHYTVLSTTHLTTLRTAHFHPFWPSTMDQVLYTSNLAELGSRFDFRWLLSASTERVQFCYGCFELQLSSKRVHMRCHYHKSSCWISQDLVRNSWLDVSMFPKQKRSETSRLIKIDTNISNDPRCDLARFRNVSKIKNSFFRKTSFLPVMNLNIREHSRFSWTFWMIIQSAGTLL